MNVATHEIAAVSAHLNEVYPMLPFTPVRGLGVYLENAAGRRILDLYYGDFSPTWFGLGMHRGALFELLYEEGNMALWRGTNPGGPPPPR